LFSNDRWESRRRRTAGHDWCIIKLGIPGIVRAVEVDTAYFTGNFSPKISIQGYFYVEEPDAIRQLMSKRSEFVAAHPEDGKMGTCASIEEMELVDSLSSEAWTMMIPLTPLGAGYESTRRNTFVIPSGTIPGGCISHLRINMGPDGGIARIKLFGEVIIRPDDIPYDSIIDLASIEIGGLALACSNKHYGHPRNLIAPGRGICMGDGWETARQPRRPPVYEVAEDGLIVLPGSDWSILKLGLPGVISSIEVDTHFYKGNYPESCLIEGCYAPNAPASAFQLQEEQEQISSLSDIDWKVLLHRTKLGPNIQHEFSSSAIQQIGPISHVKLTIFPDGGVMRLRLFGRKSRESRL